MSAPELQTAALAQRRILITGATGVLGRALSLRLAQTDAELILVARRRERLEQLDDEIAQQGGNSPLLIELDFQRADDALYENLAIQLAVEGVDDVVLCSGLHTGLHPVDHLPAKHWRNIMDVNLNGPFQLIKNLMPLLKYQHGHIVGIADPAAATPAAFLGAYGVAQAALAALLNICADEAEQRLKISHVSLAPMASPIRAAVYPGETRAALPPIAENIDKLMATLVTHVLNTAAATASTARH